MRQHVEDDEEDGEANQAPNAYPHLHNKTASSYVT